MDHIVEFIRTDTFLWLMLFINIILFILYITNVIYMKKIKKEYHSFIQKLGNGNNIEDILKQQLSKLEELDGKNQELYAFCKDINQNMKKCIQKVGIIRYSAFKDVGSDLSFAVALLDEENSGIVFNGVYSSEASNIYAKPIIKGESKYRITEEEKQAIQIAMQK